MKINLRNLSLQPRTSEKFTFEEEGDSNLIKDMGAKFVETLKVEFIVENTGRSYIGKGNIETNLELLCARCLENIIFSVESEFYVTIVEVAYKDRFFSEEEDIVFINDYDIDITPFVNEVLLISIPINLICKEDCKGLCSKCGINKNNSYCECEEKDIDPRLEKLKKLK
ncbi:hypothetical protein SYNTR_0491 [Candidatus Syntrophocurvum alkaliphilum]|uniref:DUF177 domain-containing protein n=1 Tax=Candidatus Syntrophocurvum alkaliphilum TaxID=2293317 RepID=A0A6I6DCE5_9FIRM|nr:DUF177 domain-containing protein [Candidatus Syntrophocurvum alkaliphilum]QGT99084.1 hypothetical protein SYNTR_0491 [Candidatus Syntrophocurvum alkaliphilum]